MRVLPLTLLLVLFAGSAAAKEERKVPSVGSKATSPHFEALCHFDDDAVARGTAEAAEAAWPLTLALLKQKPPQRESRLPIHVYGSVQDFELAEAALTRGSFKQNRFFTHFDTLSVYGTLLPDCDESVFEHFGPQPHYFRQITHEASHLTVYATVPNHRSHPDWLAEGIATWVAEQVSRQRGWCDDGTKSPFYSRRMVLCQRMRKRGTLPEPRAILQDRIGHLSHYDRYAAWWAFFRFCYTTHRRDLDRILAQAISLPGGAGFTMRLYTAIQDIWDARDLDKLNEGFRRYVDGFAPVWDERFRFLGAQGDAWTQIAFAGNNAIAWRVRAQDENYTIAGSVEIAPSSSPQANVLLGLVGNDFFSVALRVGTGVSLLAYRDGKWKTLKHVDHDIEAAKALPFEVRVRGATLAVRVGGSEVLSQKVHRPVRGSWGLGVQKRAGARWTNVRVKE